MKEFLSVYISVTPVSSVLLRIPLFSSFKCFIKDSFVLTDQILQFQVFY